MNQDYLKSSKNSIKHGAYDYCISSNYDERCVKFFPRLSDKEIYNLSAKYPSDSYVDLKRAIQKLFRIKNLVLSTGCEDLIIRVTNVINFNKHKVGVVFPTFYRITDNLSKYTDIAWGDVEIVNYKNLDFVFIVNPNNLNGKHIPKGVLLNLVKNNPKTVFIIDETSILFLGNWKSESFATSTNKYKNLLVISSLSKFFGLSGNRIGFATASEDLLNRLKLESTTFPVSNLGAYIAAKLISNKNLATFIRRGIEEHKNQIIKKLSNNNKVELIPSDNNCVYCKSKNKLSLYKKLISLGVVGLDLDSQKGIEQKGLVRLTIHGSDVRHNFLLSKLDLIK
jgi:histidinol-phosphate/aromatic aminotransferase/cobyric acid decarboxylase-like protein